MPIVARIERTQGGDNTRDGVGVDIGFDQLAEQLFDDFPGISRGSGPVQEHPAQTGDHAGHT